MDDDHRGFERYDELAAIQRSFLAIDLDSEPTALQDKQESGLLTKLSEILDDYQEQSYLLDPFLESLVTPVSLQLKAHAQSAVAQHLHDSDRSQATATSYARVGRLALLLYSYIKCRGHKHIVRYFPHEVADLPIALAYMQLPNSPARDLQNWSLRYVILLWLGLVCMLPFDLKQFDDDSNDAIGITRGNARGGAPLSVTAARLDSLAREYLGKAGLERDGAAILLARLYTRSDTHTQFSVFLDWFSTLPPESLDVFTAIGVLQVICNVIKSGSMEQSLTHHERISQISSIINNISTLATNSLVRKLKMKLFGRIALRSLPARPRAPRYKVRALAPAEGVGEDEYDHDDYDVEVPEHVEIALEELFQGLQDKDTIVRWSASRSIARISERLPRDFVNQVLDTIIGLFDIHSVAAASMYDMPAIAESTWHGACFALAEMARRGLVADSKLSGLLKWLSKALYFDIRKGSHSIGSSVRDAAAYTLWAFARTKTPATFKPYAQDVACHLVIVALFDREVHVRRAASATFQEHVGRMGLFPRGIDVLRMTDFYSVSIRRNAFLVAAPQVAEYIEYRMCLFDHILDVTLRHWDSSMRELGAKSLTLICSTDLAKLGPEGSRRAARLFESVDRNDIHGGLLALAEIAAAYRKLKMEEGFIRDTFRHLESIPFATIQSPRNELVAIAACHLIVNAITLAEIESGESSQAPLWRKIVETGLKNRNTTVQESASAAMTVVSSLPDKAISNCTVVRELRSASPIVQQSLGRLLGCLDYASHPHGLAEAVSFLLECLEGPPRKRLSNIEARRNCYLAMPRILNNVSLRLTDHLRPDMVGSMFQSLLQGLGDYSMDERGDVGSWIRIACIEGLASFVEILISHASSIPNFQEYLSPDNFHAAIGGILKQGVERLDGVRQEVGDRFERLLQLTVPDIPNGDLWQVHGQSCMQKLFVSDPGTERPGWNDASWLFPRAIQLLNIERYRKHVISGLILSIDSRTDSTQRFAASSLVEYTHTLPVEGPGYSLLGLSQDLVELAMSNLNSNAVIIPVLRTFNALLQADSLGRLGGCPAGLESLRSLYKIASRNLSQLKNMHRIIESMKVMVHLLSFEMLFKPCASTLGLLLAHHLPKVRTDTAEFLYTILQTNDFGFDVEGAEAILLDTDWSLADTTKTKEFADRVVGLLLSSGS